MGSLAELAELAVLAAISLLLIVGVIFRPPRAGMSREKRNVPGRAAAPQDVPGPAPSSEGSDQLAGPSHRIPGATARRQVSPGSSRTTARPARLVRDDV